MLSDSDVPYRLYRTAMGSYFIYNIYIQLIIVVFAIVMHIILRILYEINMVGPGIASIGWSILDFSL